MQKIEFFGCWFGMVCLKDQQRRIKIEYLLRTRPGSNRLGEETQQRGRMALLHIIKKSREFSFLGFD